VAVVAVAVAGLAGLGPAPAGATPADPATAAAAARPGQDPNNTPDVPVPHIIPRPNEGEAPKHDTDPGGWAQYAVFWGMCAALLVIAGLVYLESRRKLRAREEAQTRSSTRNEPVAETSEKAPESSARS
jgi:hypothetical protein